MVTIGYMEGTDSALLSKLAAAGIETTPISSTGDNHGKHIADLSASDGIDAVVGYFHKFVPGKESNLTPAALIKNCVENGIRVFVIARRADHPIVSKALGDTAADVTLVRPREIEKAILGLL
ncbi:MAG: hypothetical protein JSW52_00030 [Candidatus Coatesbacteria bacterium]|nr:MAG: hypothetical protein JSW52_00030 [Candidatus Coatesbacteria bacterium]